MWTNLPAAPGGVTPEACPPPAGARASQTHQEAIQAGKPMQVLLELTEASQNSGQNGLTRTGKAVEFFSLPENEVPQMHISKVANLL